jgi:hypothetical protein
MIRFRINDTTQEILNSLGLEYQYTCQTDGGGQSHRNRFCLLDGTVVLEVSILEQDGRGTVYLKDSGGKRNYSCPDLKQLNLLVINVGDTFSPSISFIFIRIINGRHLLHHSEYKQ